ncbi:serine/threonine-protein kinase [Streptomyces sp. NPDC050504]|uniref:serine/threonine-protein kinase n=1 Tax=Streptomyces sp. NPDC050504 TaxID=3365618 RepID=UPI0037A8157A
MPGREGAGSSAGSGGSEGPGGRGGERVVAGRYRLLSPLGQGGMGVVWRARDEVLGREVAVKEVRAPSALPTEEVRRLYARLEREAWAAARVSHRNVVTVYDVASEDGRPWIVMELIRGLSLAEVLDAEGPMRPQRAAHVGAEVLAALRSAHEAGVLHRDVKPGNVLLANDGRVVLSDFGIAMVEGTSALTMTGELIGSPEFLAPERALGRPAGPESDLWSLGVLLYAAVEGNSPFRLDTPLSTLRAVVDEELPPPRLAGALTGVIEGLLRKDPAERLSADEADHQLRIVAAGGAPRTPTTAVPPRPYAPTVTAEPGQPPTPPMPMQVPTPVPGFGPGGTGTTTVSGGEPDGRRRRAALVLAAGVAILLLAVAGITYALLRDKDNGDKDSGSDSGSSYGSSPRPGTGGQSTDSGASPSDTDSTGEASPSGSATYGGQSGTQTGDGGATTLPPVTVLVKVHVVRDSYTGACPPPDGENPAFGATVTVTRTPATVEYRWRSTEGAGTDWQTLDFPSGGGTEQQIEYTETAYTDNETRSGAVSVEIRSPQEITSSDAAFSVTCETSTPTATPTDGASSQALAPRAVRRRS